MTFLFKMKTEDVKSIKKTKGVDLAQLPTNEVNLFPKQPTVNPV